MEEALYGSVSITSTLTHGDVILSEYTIPHKKHIDQENGIAVSDIELPDGVRIVAVETDGDVEVPDDEDTLHAGDQVIVVSDRELIPQLRLVFNSL